MSCTDLNLKGLIFLLGLFYLEGFYFKFILIFCRYRSENDSPIDFFSRNELCLLLGFSSLLNSKQATSDCPSPSILFFNAERRDYPLVVDLILKLRFWLWLFTYFR